MANNLIGRQFGRYEIQQEIGKGGMARVYLALDTRLQRPVALKVMAPQLTLDDDFVRRFEREARLSAGLNHPGIVTVYDSDEQDGLLYIVMEFIDGRSLHSVLKDHGALSIGHAVSLLRPLAEALDYAHANGAIHRDVKPHNVLLSSDGRVLLTDFGIAQPAETDASSERLTRTGTFIGTPEYISPEQLTGDQVDGASDRYSFGIVAYEILTGRVPFQGHTGQLFAAHTQEPPPPPTTTKPDLPPELDPLCARMLAKQPSQRYPDAVSFVTDLQRIARQYGVVPATTDEVIDLVKPYDSAGRPTIAISSDATAIASQSPPLAGAGTTGDTTDTTPPPPERETAYSEPPPPPPLPPSPPGPTVSYPGLGSTGTPGTVTGAPSPPPPPAPDEEEEEQRRGGGWLNSPLLWIGGMFALAVIVLLGIVLAFGGRGNNPTPVPVETPTATSVPALPPPTSTPVTPPTNTPITPPTNTPVTPPTNTPVVVPTNTPPPPPPPPTNTPLPTNTLPPLPTHTPVTPPTHTPITPPTNTPITPPTNTPVVPTSTPPYPNPATRATTTPPRPIAGGGATSPSRTARPTSSSSDNGGEGGSLAGNESSSTAITRMTSTASITSTTSTSTRTPTVAATTTMDAYPPPSEQ